MWKNLTEFTRSRLMSRFDQEIDARKPAKDSERSMEVCEGFCDSSMARNRAISVVDRDTLFFNNATRNFRRKLEIEGNSNENF
eukprot:scaffold39251_cov77-Cyclotella_meneghiniana.AAC.15